MSRLWNAFLFLGLVLGLQTQFLKIKRKRLSETQATLKNRVGLWFTQPQILTISMTVYFRAWKVSAP